MKKVCRKAIENWSRQVLLDAERNVAYGALRQFTGLEEENARMTITIDAVSIPDGKHATIELTKTGDRSGLIKVDGQSFNLTNIKTSSDGLNLTCDGPLGSTVTCSIHSATPQANPFISVDIKSFFFHSTKNYQITPENQQKLVEFIRQSFPPAIA